MCRALTLFFISVGVRGHVMRRLLHWKGRDQLVKGVTISHSASSRMAKMLNVFRYKVIVPAPTGTQSEARTPSTLDMFLDYAALSHTLISLHLPHHVHLLCNPARTHRQCYLAFPTTCTWSLFMCR
jgi:hypothetical protein